MIRLRLFALALAGVAVLALADDTPETLQQRFNTAGLLSPQLVHQFYQQRDFQPAWTGAACAEALSALVEAIQASETHGLDSGLYHRDVLTRPDACAADIELLATDAWLTLASHLYFGRVRPLSVEPDWSAERPSFDFAAPLEKAVASGQIRDTLLGLAPDQPYYQALRAALAQFRDYQEAGGWGQVDAGPTLRLGDSGLRVEQLRSRLLHSGLLEAQPLSNESAFDEALEAAVKAFQLRANLEPDGVVGPMTLAQLNLDVDHRIDQLRVNLERWRWLPDHLGERHIRVNIPDFHLEARAEGGVEQEHRVIVGKLARNTPVFSGRIQYLVLNPWWETPRKLAVQDKLPLFRKDPAAVQRLGFEVMGADGKRVDASTIDWASLSAAQFPYRLRQRPGPLNALGQVKLMFPNPHQVFLHDTPTRGLFAKVRRDFSSGCIRVEDALGLTQWVLEQTAGWDRARIDAAVASGAETRVTLSKTVPVHILYLTVVPGGSDGVRFIDDLYGRDPAALAALDA